MNRDSKNMIKTVYGIKHKNENIRALSRSGGIFTALSDLVLDDGGVVYGCALNERLEAVHKRATTKQERDLFRGSKYVQTQIGYVLRDVEKDLKDGIIVLFSGAPCQVNGLLNYLTLKKVDMQKLFTIEILCHGAPSPRVWQDFIDNNFDREKIDAVDFRDKKNFGWRDHVETITVDGREISSRDYTKLFYSHLGLRQSCFNCYYKKTERVSDITIGDFWRIENNDKAFDDDKGISLVKLNSPKGQEYFDRCKNQLVVREYPLATCIQPALDHNYNEPSNRADFWAEYNGDNLMPLIKKYTAEPVPSAKQRIISLAKRIIKKIIKAVLKLFRIV